MTHEEFYTELAETRTQFMWRNVGGLLRGYEECNNPTCYCPVTAVASYVTGDYYDLDEVPAAAGALDLDIQFAQDVACSADFDVQFDPIREKLNEVLLCKPATGQTNS